MAAQYVIVKPLWVALIPVSVASAVAIIALYVRGLVLGTKEWYGIVVLALPVFMFFGARHEARVCTFMNDLLRKEMEKQEEAQPESGHVRK